MINGTKLLNVAGMTRGRRDGILKSEKTRHVVKIGPMHLKGVWIPFERALDFANKEKITEQLYPLFVHNIGALLYHPQNNANRASISAATMPGAERRRPDGQADYMRTPQSSQAPPLQHHHSMSNPIGAHIQQPPHSIAPHPASGRPGLDRAHTFPTPPTSASSVMGMGNSGSSYEWSGAHVSSTPTTQTLSIDTGLSNARSVPTTPATTPPGNQMQSMHNYSSSYDGSRQLYATSQPPHYRYPYVKNEMAPPARAGAETEHLVDNKAHHDGYSNHSQEHPSEEGDGEHEGEYTHSAAPYGSNRASYGYTTQATPTSMQSEHGHISPETMTGSPQKGSGRATPRTATYTGYNTPQRAQQLPSSNLYSVMSDNRGATNGADMYAPHNGYANQSYAPTNGIPSNKRVRELDDNEEQYATPNNRNSNGVDTDPPKRRKTVREGSIGATHGQMPSGPHSVAGAHRR